MVSVRDFRSEAEIMAATSTRSLDVSEADRTNANMDGPGQLVIETLANEDCRSILEATGREAKTASELSDACDIPLSTTYRKLERLTDAGLLEESLRLSHSGKHTTEYRHTLIEIHVSVGPEDGFAMTVGSRGAPAETR